MEGGEGERWHEEEVVGGGGGKRWEEEMDRTEELGEGGREGRYEEWNKTT